MELKINNKWICDYCNTEFKNRNLLREHKHLFSHLDNHGRRRIYKCEICNEEFDTKLKITTHKKLHKKIYSWKCTICQQDFASRKRLQEHRKNEHITEIKSKFYGSHPIVNKSCQFCGKICSRQNDLTRHEKYCHKNPNALIWYGHKVSDETKKKLSDIAIKNMKGTHCNWLNKPKSYAEEYFEKCFDDADFQYRVNRYVLDFAWPEIKTYIEVDGEQHYTEDGLKHDKERTEILLNEGWKLLKRIRWSDFQKLSKIEKINEVYRLKQSINLLLNYPHLTQFG